MIVKLNILGLMLLQQEVGFDILSMWKQWVGSQERWSLSWV